MSEFLLSPEAEAELDAIWIRLARESGSTDVAARVVESIVERFGYLPGIRTLAGGVTTGWVPVCAASRLMIMSSFIASKKMTSC